MLARSSGHDSNPADLDPRLERSHPRGAILAGGNAVAAEIEDAGDLVVGVEEAMCLLRQLEALYPSLSRLFLSEPLEFRVHLAVLHRRPRSDRAVRVGRRQLEKASEQGSCCGGLLGWSGTTGRS